jgi:DNA-binding NarL/FixJ family response regulator
MSHTHPVPSPIFPKAERAAAEGTRGRIRVLLVEDHPLFRERLGMLINRELGMEIMGEAPGEREALELMAQCAPDVVILDITLKEGSGMSLLRRLRSEFAAVPALVLSMHEESVHAPRCLKLGAKGYVMKTEAAEQVLNAIRTVHAGGFHLSPAMRAVIKEQIERRAVIEAPDIGALSERELEVFDLFGSGLAVRDVAGRLRVSEGTVDTYVQRIKRKLGLISVVEVWQCARHRKRSHTG